MTKIAGSGSESIRQRHGSADPDPDPPQNVMDPQHCQKVPQKKKSSPDPRRASAKALMEAKAEELHRKIKNIRMFFLNHLSLI
jgi:hypothetical protein